MDKALRTLPDHQVTFPSIRGVACNDGRTRTRRRRALPAVRTDGPAPLPAALRGRHDARAGRARVRPVGLGRPQAPARPEAGARAQGGPMTTERPDPRIADWQLERSRLGELSAADLEAV